MSATPRLRAAMLEEVLATAKPPSADEPVAIYGDSSYGVADLVEHIEAAGAEANVKVQPASAVKGHFAQDAFTIDMDSKTVTCPNGQLVQIRVRKDGSGIASFDTHCATCPLRAQCTDSASGRTVRIPHPKHKTLARSRARQRDPNWKQRYRAVRPKVERKFGHLMRRKHGGRRVAPAGSCPYCSRLRHARGGRQPRPTRRVRPAPDPTKRRVAARFARFHASSSLTKPQDRFRAFVNDGRLSSPLRFRVGGQAGNLRDAGGRHNPKAGLGTSHLVPRFH